MKLVCQVEAYPIPIVYWTTEEGDILAGSKSLSAYSYPSPPLHPLLFLPLPPRCLNYDTTIPDSSTDGPVWLSLREANWFGSSKESERERRMNSIEPDFWSHIEEIETLSDEIRWISYPWLFDEEGELFDAAIFDKAGISKEKFLITAKHQIISETVAEFHRLSQIIQSSL